MSAPHFVGGAPAVGERLVLQGQEAAHALRSLRARPGDELTSTDGEGGFVRCVVERAGRHDLEARVLHRDVRERPDPQVAVWLAAPKGDRLAWAVQKLAELGVDAIGVLEAGRSVRRWSGERAERLPERLRAIAVEAVKQSRGRFLPAISGPKPWDEAMDEELAAGRPVVLWEQAREPLLGLLPPDAARVSLFVGPEGGIPEEDARSAQRRGAALASLGPTLLRTETAALAGTAIALAGLGRLG